MVCLCCIATSSHTMNLASFIGNQHHFSGTHHMLIFHPPWLGFWTCDGQFCLSIANSTFSGGCRLDSLNLCLFNTSVILLLRVSFMLDLIFSPESQLSSYIIKVEGRPCLGNQIPTWASFIKNFCNKIYLLELNLIYSWFCMRRFLNQTSPFFVYFISLHFNSYNFWIQWTKSSSSVIMEKNCIHPVTNLRGRMQ
jgi:hypothetical protein